MRGYGLGDNRGQACHGTGPQAWGRPDREVLCCPRRVAGDRERFLELSSCDPLGV